MKVKIQINKKVLNFHSFLYSFKVYKEFLTHKVNYQVMQRRFDGSVNFNRNWAEYLVGFGNNEGEFWMG